MKTKIKKVGRVKLIQNDISFLYRKWEYKTKQEPSLFIPFCNQDTWSGTMVGKFADFLIKEGIQEGKRIMYKHLTHGIKGVPVVMDKKSLDNLVLEGKRICYQKKAKKKLKK
jgi:hypothetical protein